MPRRVLAALTALVAALHALVLFGLPRWTGGTDASRPEALAFHTRMLPPPAPPAPEPAAAPEPPAAQPVAPPPPPRPAKVRKPRPAPPAAAPAPEPSPAEEAMPSTPPVPADAGEAPSAPPMAEAPPTAPTEATTDTATDAAQAARNAAQAAAALASAPSSTASSAASNATAAAADASDPADTRNAGVEILPPNGPAIDASAKPPPVQLPPPLRLAFDVSGEVKKFAYRANATLVWRHDDAGYEARQEAKAFLLGSRSQTSSGVVTPAGLQPRRFGDQARKEQTADFDFGTGRATFSGGGAPAAIAAGAQDRLSVFIQLGALLAAAPDRYPDGTRITFTTVGARNADRWTFTIEGTETLDLPIGPTPALKLERLPRRDADEKAELWLAPSLGFLPARIRLTKGNGDYVDLQLSGRSSP
ncbi:DUF3108 domain-containing protein [Acidovorax sp. NCPPB 3859]|nr:MULTISPECIES: DUF3108 domain-containing protein [unclassified Acidovorax]MDA8450026.1 DUF3108 domain-containing protein [Acidovorax sp. GBBC 3297]MDA8459629.1 DUF3108 domain-containing protein [Acidovorax sp. GBBC 3333]MDA8464508.1 DUF3108 domain-containing protein [Acidovorax sp. GBBC 3332]MDA8469699.1 DUF3108 domain-containing protein [Acidovorax sp. GBBC 3299]WCM79337.1 DUF3108 domain-containing protein [Acidovorax sp. GBBC 712]